MVLPSSLFHAIVKCFFNGSKSSGQVLFRHTIVINLTIVVIVVVVLFSLVLVLALAYNKS